MDEQTDLIKCEKSRGPGRLPPGTGDTVMLITSPRQGVTGPGPRQQARRPYMNRPDNRGPGPTEDVSEPGQATLGLNLLQQGQAQATPTLLQDPWVPRGRSGSSFVLPDHIPAQLAEQHLSVLTCHPASLCRCRRGREPKLTWRGTRRASVLSGTLVPPLLSKR